MDDIRRPYRGERRDYALPADRRPTDNTTDLRPPVPQHQPQTQHHHQPQHQPQHHAEPTAHNPAAPAQLAYHQPQYQTQPHHQPQAHTQHQPQAHPAHHKTKRRLKLGLNWPVMAAVALAVIALVGGFYLLKPKSKPQVTPTQLAAQASFNFYYPTPPPDGYAYDKQISTFNAGQAYYLLASGRKHIIVHEQAANANKLDLSTMSNPSTFVTSNGQAAVGSLAGESAGLLLTNSTLVTLNSTGKVPLADIQAVINNFRTLQK